MTKTEQGTAVKHPKITGVDIAERFGKILGIIFCGVVVFFAGQLAGVFLARFILEPFSGLSEMTTIVIGYAIQQAISISLLLGLAYLFRAKLPQMGLGGVKDWTYVALLPLIFMITLLMAGVASILVTILVSGYNADQVQDLGLPVVGKDNLLLTGIFLVVIVPLCEEFIFRGWLFGLLRRYAPFWLVTIIVSAIFGLAHGQWNVGINVFFLSLALCFLREKTGSIWVGVGLHSLKNLVAFLLLFVYNIV